jgi:iron complex transport system ATP-binding protein
MSFLQISGLNIGYKNNLIQENINLNLNAGEMVCLIGQNGCGKSTLLRTLAGLQNPLKGNIFINKKNSTLLNNGEKSLLISFVLTDKVAVDNLSVFDLVFTGRYPHTSWLGNRTKTDIEKTMQAIEEVHLSHKTHSYINQLSDGEKQRALIAKALAQETPLIFLDEPTAHLDLPNRAEVMLLLHQLAKETGKGIIVSTHELDLALQTADTLWLMSQSGIKTGSPKDISFQESIEQSFRGSKIRFETNGEYMRVVYPQVEY